MVCGDNDDDGNTQPVLTITASDNARWVGVQLPSRATWTK